MKILLPTPVYIALEGLEQGGHEAFVIGGCVRDSLLLKTPDDWDICTSALPDEIKDCFPLVPTIDTGLKYGTVTVIIDHMELQITTYRIDSAYSDYRRPDQVSFTPSLQEDCRRRDFTVNAMAYNPKTGLMDFFGGLEDLKNKKIRCVGDASERFTEDALRVLRALRFASVLRYEIEANTAMAIHRNKQLLRHISVERIAVEMNKLLMGDHVEKVLTEFVDVFEIFLPKITLCAGRMDVTGKSVWEHTALSIRKGPLDLSVRLALLFHEIDEMPDMCATIAQRTLKQLRVDKDTIQKTVLLVENQCACIENTHISILRLFKQFGPDCFMNILALKEACLKARQMDLKGLELVMACRKTAREILSGNYCWSIAQLKIDGNDLIHAGLKEGVLVGECLDYLTDRVIEGHVKNNKEDLIHYVLNYLSTNTQHVSD